MIYKMNSFPEGFARARIEGRPIIAEVRGEHDLSKALDQMDDILFEASKQPCCVCGKKTRNEPNVHDNIYCSLQCFQEDGNRVACPDCDRFNCRCLEELFA